MKIIIVSGGHVSSELLSQKIKSEAAQMILCADSGANVLYKAKIQPDVLLGDFDSIDEEVFQYFVEKGIKTVRFKAEKDITDTEIAIEYAIKLGATNITLFGATGSRLDHTLANIYVLEKYAPQVSCKIVDAHNSIELLMGNASCKYNKNQYPYISLIPLSKKVKGVTTQGFKYPLFLANLERKSSYGISNEIINETGTVTMVKGTLAIIQSKD